MGSIGKEAKELVLVGREVSVLARGSGMGSGLTIAFFGRVAGFSDASGRDGKEGAGWGVIVGEVRTEGVGVRVGGEGGKSMGEEGTIGAEVGSTEGAKKEVGGGEVEVG